MATLTKCNDFVEYLAHGELDLETDQLAVALSNTAPGSETPDPTGDNNGTLTNVTEISYTNLSARAITTSSSGQTSGTYALSLTDLTLSATGAVATFRYIYVYDDTHASDVLIGVYDYGSGLTLASGESLTIDFGANGAGAGNLLTIT